MRLIVLNDEVAGICPAEHGLSFLIEADRKILFDVGPSDMFKNNALELGLNLDDIYAVVLSHGHWDHGNGLKFIKYKKLICHPACFTKRYRKKDKSYIGLPVTLEEARESFDLIVSKEPYNISDKIIFLGEVPRRDNFEAKSTSFIFEDGKDDFVIDDSALAVKSNQGLIVVAGCSHAGICNIIEYARKVSGIKKVHAIIGGFHLKEVDEVTLETIAYLKKQKIDKIFPSHCVGIPVIKLFEKELGAIRVRSGDTIDL
jgi:7,8-dihydropterin-6-yl-methyl-4-(beta-D-ribofuranosyl)aminobenzene 5'-phosphate synthase